MTLEQGIRWSMNEGWDMTNYQVSMLQRDKCAEKSREALKKNDTYMFEFWSNASREFERRATEQLTEMLKRKKRAVLYEMWRQGRLPFVPISMKEELV